MKIKLAQKAKTDIVFYLEKLQNLIIIYSPSYEIVMYKELYKDELYPWKAYSFGDITNIGKELLTPRSIPRYIYIKEYGKLKKLQDFLKELYLNYQIVGIMVK